MKYRRSKPNAEPWKRRQVPPVETPPIDMAQAVAEVLAPILPTLQAVSMALDEMCAINGHRWRDDIYPGQVTCATCGRFCDEVYGTEGEERWTHKSKR